MAQSSSVALRIARELVRQKITGQANVARFKLLETATANAVDQCVSEVRAEGARLRQLRLPTCAG
jgi:hypothetical protein